MSYLPIPPRVWSRVQNECSVNTSSSNLVFEPLTGQFLPQEEYNRLKQIQIKGNILQYKNNSTKMTKNQKYSQIAKGKWINRTKTWATQSYTYSNPNTTSLQRVNTSTLAATANTPFVTNIYSIPPNPFGCPIDASGGIIDGGNLVGTVTVNPCTNQIIKITSVSNCNLSTDCDVPGPPIALCWNPRLPTYYPRQNLINNNSTDKWPINYKGLVSAYIPISVKLTATLLNDDITKIKLNWSATDQNCINSWNLYQNNILIGTYPNDILSDTIINLIPNITYEFYIQIISPINDTSKSNIISVTPTETTVFQTIPGSYIYTIPENSLYYNVTVIGGGGGGGGGANYGSGSNNLGCLGGSGGGGGGISIVNSNVAINGNSQFVYVVGKGGIGGSYTPPVISYNGVNGDNSTFNDGLTINIISYGGGGGLYDNKYYSPGNTTYNAGGQGGSASGGDINGTGGTGGNSGGIGTPTGDYNGFYSATAGSSSTYTDGPGGGGGGGCIFLTPGNVFFKQKGEDGGDGGNGAQGGAAGIQNNPPAESGVGTLGYGGSGGGGVGGNNLSSVYLTGTAGSGIYGSGGGGGGATNGFTKPGNGGKGGDGVVYFTVYGITIV